jgi:hypothetical protein
MDAPYSNLSSWRNTRETCGPADKPSPPGAGSPAPAPSRAIASAHLALSLAELLRAGSLIPDALAAWAAAQSRHDPAGAAPFQRIADAVRCAGLSLSEAAHRERASFTPRFLAILSLANLSGQLFRTFLQRLREFARDFHDLPPAAQADFPPMTDEVREFCFFFGHLTVERASQPETQRWLPRIFTPRLRLPATHLLARFFDQGLLLSDALARTPPFDDPEIILAVQAGEERNRVGAELVQLADWLVERRRLRERLRCLDCVLPVAAQSPSPAAIPAPPTAADPHLPPSLKHTPPPRDSDA